MLRFGKEEENDMQGQLAEAPLTTDEMEISLKALRALHDEAKFELNKQAQVFSNFKKLGGKHLKTLDSQQELKNRFTALKALIQDQLKNISRNNGRFDLQTYIKQLKEV